MVGGPPCHENVQSRERKECGCISSTDIGAYDTCNNRCLYCYANANHDVSSKNYLSHNPNSPLIIGELEDNDKITEKEMKSCVDLQTSIFSKMG